MQAVIRSFTVTNYTRLCEIRYTLLPSKLYVNTATSPLPHVFHVLHTRK